MGTMVVMVMVTKALKCMVFVCRHLISDHDWSGAYINLSLVVSLFLLSLFYTRVGAWKMPLKNICRKATWSRACPVFFSTHPRFKTPHNAEVDGARHHHHHILLAWRIYKQVVEEYTIRNLPKIRHETVLVLFSSVHIRSFKLLLQHWRRWRTSLSPSCSHPADRARKVGKF